MATWAQYWSGVAPSGSGQWYMDPSTQMWSYGAPPPGATTQAQFQQQVSAGTYNPPPVPGGGTALAGTTGETMFDDSGYQWKRSANGTLFKTGVYQPGGSKVPVPPQPSGVPTPSTGGFATGAYTDAQALANQQLLARGGNGDLTGRGGVPTIADLRSGAGVPATQPFDPGTARISPPITPPPITGGGNPASTQAPPPVQYPIPGTPPVPVAIQPPGGGGFSPSTDRIPPPVTPPSGGPPASQGGSVNPAGGAPGGSSQYGWGGMNPTVNPYSTPGGAGSVAPTNGILAPTAPTAASPFSASTATPTGTPQLLTGGAPQGSPADAFLSQNAIGSMDPLRSIISGGGNPIDQLPAWQAMKEAQQRGIAEGQARLNANFDVSGNRFSNAFGTASTDYQNQAVKDQNALLAQMVAGAGESAQGRLLNAGTSLAGLGQQAAGQLSNQDFQSIMQQYGISADMAKYLAGGADTAASQLAGLGAAGSNAIYGGSLAGANALFGGENTGAQSMYGAQNSTLPAFMNYLLGSGQQGLQGATDLSQLWNQNLTTGSQLGQQQYTIGQNDINNAYQEWLRTQPTNNPLLSMMFSGATGYPQLYNPSYQPGVLGSLLQGVGSIAGAVAGTKGFSDIRLKENIMPVGWIKDLPLYSYNFKGLPGTQFGFLAQEVYQHYPTAVVPGDDFNPWMIKVDELSRMLEGHI